MVAVLSESRAFDVKQMHKSGTFSSSKWASKNLNVESRGRHSIASNTFLRQRLGDIAFNTPTAI